MLQTIGSWIQTIIDFIATVFTVVWTILVGIVDFFVTVVGGLYTAISEGQDFLQEVLPNAFKWMWQNWLNPLIDAMMVTVDDFNPTQYIEGIPFVDIMVNNYVTHFVNVDLVVTAFSAACLFMLTLSFLKFCIKLIPTIG